MAHKEEADAKREQRVCKLEMKNRELEAENYKKDQRIKELERTSQTSSRRPSSEIVKPPRERRRKDRKIGGQPGHPLHRREPFSEQNIDTWIQHLLYGCPDCSSGSCHNAGHTQ